MSNLLELKNISKHYSAAGGSKLRALDDISFVIQEEEKGNIITLLGPFKSGKSSLLRIISSIEKPDSGIILLHNKTDLGAESRIIYLPETPASYPWLSVQKNLEMALKLPNVKGKFSLKEIVDLVGLSGYENHYPANNSYGFRFRISLGRALAVNPEIIIIDDSFSKMDQITRDEMHSLVKQINIYTGTTIILGTNSITEAVILSQRILFMKKNPGRIFYDLKLDKDISGGTMEINSLRNSIEEIYKSDKSFEPLQLTL